jgi:hypothetical protein
MLGLRAKSNGILGYDPARESLPPLAVVGLLLMESEAAVGRFDGKGFHAGQTSRT